MRGNDFLNANPPVFSDGDITLHYRCDNRARKTPILAIIPAVGSTVENIDNLVKSLNLTYPVTEIVVIKKKKNKQ